MSSLSGYIVHLRCFHGEEGERKMTAVQSTRCFYGGSRINPQHHMVAHDHLYTQFWITLFWPLALLDRHNYCFYIQTDKAPTHIK